MSKIFNMVVFRIRTNAWRAKTLGLRPKVLITRKPVADIMSATDFLVKILALTVVVPVRCFCCRPLCFVVVCIFAHLFCLVCCPPFLCVVQMLLLFLCGRIGTQICFGLGIVFCGILGNVRL